MKKFTIIIGLIIHFGIYAQEKDHTMKNTEYVTLGGGCFWCTEAVFEEVEGVSNVVSGYSGGNIKNPTYREVTSGRTGHAEVVHFEFNPKKIEYRKILEIFFKTHDPTTLNRQGADVGTQYRSVIFYHNDKQREITKEVINSLNNQGIYNNKIVTEITPFTEFYPAETYHQDYFRKNPDNAYCGIVIQPKVNKLRKEFKNKLKGIN